MPGEVLMALAQFAGQTVAAAAITDVWEAVRGRFARLLGRGDPRKTEVAEQWLAQDPGLEAGLRALVEEVAAQLPVAAVSAADHSVAAGRDVTITASGGGTAAGVIHGSVAPPNPPGPGPAQP